MRRLAFALCALSFPLAACGGEDGMTFPDRRVIDIVDAGDGPDSNPLLPDAGLGPDGSLNPENCNTTQQNCVDAVESKCTVICTTPSTCETECLAPTGTLGEGETCMRESNDTAGIGHDPCSAGFFCSGIGLPPGPPPERACRRFCDSNVNCMVAGEQCASLDGMGPLQGICVPTCVPFGTCPTNMSCSISINNNGADGMGTCRPNGLLAHGNPCTATADCGANMNCISDGAGGGICASLCDSTHACPGGTSCTAVPPLPNGGGFCQ